MITLLNLLFVIFSSSAQDAHAPFMKQSLEEITAHFQAATIPIADFASALNKQSYDFLCLGETHEDLYRNIYGQLIKDLQFANLALEATPEDIAVLQKDWTEKKTTLHIGVSLNPVMEAIEGRGIPLTGVEETLAQEALTYKDKHLSRDGFIAQNIIAAFDKANGKTVALYGSTHCSFNNKGLGAVPYFNFLSRSWTGKKLINTVVLLRKSPTVNPLIAYIDIGETPKRDVVVVDGNQLKPEDYNYNWEIRALFDNFRYVIVY